MASDVIGATLDKPWHKQLALKRAQTNRGSFYPPMSIEPLPHMRSRLGGQGMSTEERVLRRQWIQAQYLAPNEPNYGPYEKLHFRKNIFRRPLTGVWENFCNFLISVTNRPKGVGYLHYTFPRLLGAVAVSYWLGYLLKYHKGDWTKETGWNISFTREPEYDLTKPYVPKPDNEFFARGFTTRKVLLNEK
ncbi:hypothetical protein LOTGIDRAFT_232340 [Lottia gigantea]|uniref:Uncharacterized protein n=1 Tax=Lottia gigantea TaxID=225164 RepID=V3ZSS9_LOTGI|nr:hypothetical protein LOTGIDRAFT_232340 [Lottia gigantea]ESO94503.1 hypothetical protein LOTGIDRAFT_232340 [Lottia gigantea]